jgi:hypothetical protein
MEAQWIGDRATLRSLLRQHPNWTNPHYAQAVGRSVSWVKQGKIRLSQTPADDGQGLLARSRAHHGSSHRWHPQVIQRLGEMREQPPEYLQRVPGTKALVTPCSVILSCRPSGCRSLARAVRSGNSYANTAISCPVSAVSANRLSHVTP